MRVYCSIIERTKSPLLAHFFPNSYEVAPRSDSEESDSDYEEEVCVSFTLKFLV